MSVSSEVQRTLVKSPPELWAELSDPASLASHLGELGEIRIVRTVPETTVEWEAPEATGRVQIKPSAWGTKVTLTATQELPQPASQAPPERVEAEPTMESSSETAAQPGGQPTADPGTQLDAGRLSLNAEVRSPERAGSQPAPDPQSVGPVAGGSQPAPAPSPGALADDCCEPGFGGESEPPASETELQGAGQRMPGDLPATEPAPRKRLFARARRRLRKLRSVTVPSGSVEPEQSAEGPLVPEASAVAPDHEASAVAPDQPSLEISVGESADEQSESEPSALPAEHPGSAASATGASESRSDPPEGTATEARAVVATGASPEPSAVESLAGDHVTAVLTSVLDRLGAAHHRPFSRG
jgi:hypothetical protein